MIRTIFDTTSSSSSESELFHYTVEKCVVDLLQHGQSIVCELDWTTKSLESLSFLVHSNIEPLLEHTESASKPPYTSPSNGNLERPSWASWKTKSLKFAGSRRCKSFH